MKTAAIVAVKIIDIDESDTLNPRQADSYAEFLKEVNALRLLSENNAKNINHVLEALPVGKAMWMITEYCGGGSVATLVSPITSLSSHSTDFQLDETNKPWWTEREMDYPNSARGCSCFEVRSRSRHHPS